MSKNIKLDHGFSAKITHDHDCEQPFLGDDGVHIVVLSNKYTDPANGSCGTTPAEVATWEAENKAEWFSVPLWFYDHTSTSYRTGFENPFSCKFDSGRAGIVALKRSEWGSGNESDEALFSFSETIAKNYTDWANGENYLYEISDSAGNIVDSCSGFIGYDDTIEQMREAAGAFYPEEQLSMAM